MRVRSSLALSFELRGGNKREREREMEGGREGRDSECFSVCVCVLVCESVCMVERVLSFKFLR